MLASVDVLFHNGLRIIHIAHGKIVAVHFPVTGNHARGVLGPEDGQSEAGR
jgi:hypothetical protein